MKKNLASPHGFSLVEMMMALGIFSILTVASYSAIVNLNNAKTKAQNDSELQSTLFETKNKLSNVKSAGYIGSRCQEILTLISAPAFDNKSGITHVRINLNNTQILQGDSVVASSKIKINKLYLTDNILVHTSTSGVKTYVSNLVVEAKADDSLLSLAKKRILTTISISINAAGTNMVSCNTSPNENTDDNQSFCQSFNGFIWDQVGHKCVKELGDNGSNFDSPPGTWVRNDGLSVPTATDCGPTKLPKGFTDGVVSSCTQAAAGNIIGLAPQAQRSTPANPSDNQSMAPARPSSNNTFTNPPASTQTVTNPNASQTASGSCSANNSISQFIYDMCQLSGFSCNLQNLVPSGATCTSTVNYNYQTPSLNTVAPDPLPTTNSTCMCNNQRISNGEYCMYCLKDINIGGGINESNIGVYSCNSGVLTKVSNAELNTSSNWKNKCTNTFRKAMFVGGNKYEQIP